VRIYRPKIEPATPNKITNQMFKPNIICKKTMMVKAGRKGKNTTSNKKDPTKTNRYCHHIFITFYDKVKNTKCYFQLFPKVKNLL